MKAVLFDQSSDRVEAFLVTRDKDQLQIGELVPELLPGVQNQTFFGVLRAAGDQYGIVVAEIKKLPKPLSCGIIPRALDTIEFDGAGDMYAGCRNTEGREAIGIGLGLCGDE